MANAEILSEMSDPDFTATQRRGEEGKEGVDSQESTDEAQLV